jgi:RND family efflux transporter MFP subunit
MTEKQQAAEPHKRRRWWLVFIPIILFSAGYSLHEYRLHQADESPSVPTAPWALQTAPVTRGSVSDEIQTSAIVEATNVIALSPQIQGAVTEVGPRSGVAVKRGQLLVRIDARSIRDDLAALEKQHRAGTAEADYAARQHQRIQEVLANGGVSRSQADQARTTAADAQAKAQALASQIDALRVKLGYAQITAPEDAVVAERLVAVGDTVRPGRPVYHLIAGKGAIVRVTLAADQLERVHVGDRIVLSNGAASLTLPVTRIAPAVNQAGLGFAEAEAESPPFSLPSGISLPALLYTASCGNTLTVPLNAMVGSGNHAHVFVFVPGQDKSAIGTLRRVDVQVLQTGAERVAVAGKLEPDTQVVIGQTAQLAQLRDGDPAVTGLTENEQ